MDIEKFKTMEPMKYVGGSAAKARVKNFLEDPMTYKGWLYSLKVDGEWARIIHDMDGNVLIQGRGISKATGEHTENSEKLPHLVEDIKKIFPKGTVLLGELAFDDMETNQREVGSILRSLPPRAIKLQEERKLMFHIFDVLAYDGKDLSNLPFKERLEPLVDYSPLSSYIYRIQFEEVAEDTLNFLDNVLEHGGEGIMLMNPKSKYLEGSRSVTISLKIKKELGELTLPVIGLVEPIKEYRGDNPYWEYEEDGIKVTRRYYEGWENGVVVDYKGTEVKVVSGLNDSEAEWLATQEARDMIAAGELKVDITAMSETGVGGKPNLRHPVLLKLRTDLGGE